MRSLRTRLIAVACVAVAATSIAACVVLFVALRTIMHEQFDRRLAEDFRSVSMNVWVGNDANVYLDMDTSIVSDYAPNGIKAFQLWNADGTRVIQRSPLLDAHRGDLPRPPGVSPAEPRYADVTLPDGRPARALGRLIRTRLSFDPADKTLTIADGATTMSVDLVVARDRGELDAALSSVATAMTVVAVALPALACLLVAFIIGVGLRPLTRFAERAAQVDSTSDPAPFPVEGPAELRPIAERLNGLVQRLDQAFQRERRFTSDAAHELRTPIAELRTLTDVALRWPDDTARLTQALKSANLLSHRMGRLVNALLTLARQETILGEVAIQDVDVRALVQRTIQAQAEAARAKALQLTISGPASLRCETDSSILSSILSNLVANAIAYTPTGGAVRLTLTPAPGGFHFRIANEAPDLTREDLDRVFDPFWRKSATHSDQSHSGLGLTLAQSFAEILGLTLDVNAPEPGWVEFTLASGRAKPAQASPPRHASPAARVSS